MAGFSRAGPNQHTSPRAGVRHYLGAAKDDDGPVYGPPATGQPDHDALDDAANDSGILFHLSQRSGTLLDSFKHRRHRHTILHYWMGAAVPAVSQEAVGCDDTTTGARGVSREDSGPWKYE